MMCPRHSNTDRRRRGLSIIEVTTASVLLIVAMAPILLALTKANLWSTKIEQKTQSLFLAQGKLDNIRGYAAYNFGSSGSFTDSNVVLSGSYLCNVTDSIVSTDLKQITVSVGYDSSGSGTLSSNEVLVTLTTYIANRW